MNICCWSLPINIIYYIKKDNHNEVGGPTIFAVDAASVVIDSTNHYNTQYKLVRADTDVQV